MTTKANTVMTPDAYLVSPNETIGKAALLMREKDVGAVAVSDEDKLVGMLTDRDIAVRAVARNKGAETTVGEIMSRSIKYCYDDDEVRDVAHNMADLQIRRLPVVNRDKRLVGFITLANIASAGDAADTAALLDGTATPH